jgi:hypothetical protein
VARVAFGLRNLLLGSAESEWIALVSLRARADRNVVDNIANGALAASSNARILALIPQASLAPVTLVVEHALRAAALVRISEMLRDAFADGVVV